LLIGFVWYSLATRSPRPVIPRRSYYTNYRCVPQDVQSNPCLLLPLTEAAVLVRFLAAAGSALSPPLLPIVRPNDLWSRDPLSCRETVLQLRFESWRRRRPLGADPESCALFSGTGTEESGGIGTGILEIGLRDCKDLGVTAVLLVTVSAFCGVEVSSFALSCTGVGDSPNRIAKGFLDAESLVDAFMLSPEPSVSVFTKQWRSESMSRISCTYFMVRSFVRSTGTRFSRLRGLDAAFTIGGSCA
jgi:hypothetical protein